MLTLLTENKEWRSPHAAEQEVSGFGMAAKRLMIQAGVTG